MPVTKCNNGKYRIGDGACVYTSRKKALDAYRAYLAKDKGEDSPGVAEVDKQIQHEVAKIEAALQRYREQLRV